MAVMKTGRVYWITGLAGSGKTTIGTELYYSLRAENDNVLILSGDILKKIVGDSVGYEEEDRLARGKKYSEICKLLADQGMWVIICTIAMFDEIREWNRKNIKGYIEIFLDVPMQILQERNKRGLYSKQRNQKVAGTDISVQFPKNPDLVLKNDNNASIKELVEQIKQLIPKNEDDFDRDKLYWNDYYKVRDGKIMGPSNFAETIGTELKKDKSLLDLGCGNGRDSLYFLDRGLAVTGIDASDVAINNLQDITRGNGNAVFVCDDFVKCRTVYQRQYDYIYSRFTLHAIDDTQENELLKNILDALKKDGRVFIEARTIHDDLYGKGREIGRNTFIYDGHFRRFVDGDELQKKMKAMGYSIVVYNESRGYSKNGDSDPMLLRLIATVSEQHY